MSVTSLAYFLSGQRTAIEKIWRHELTSDKVVAYRNLPLAVLSDSSSYPVLNTVYLVDHVIRHKYPLNLDALEGCPTNFLMAATRVPSCRLDFLRLGQDDLYRIFKACLAVPACAVGPVRVGETEIPRRRYRQSVAGATVAEISRHSNSGHSLETSA